jgi:hypothetical protein
MDNENNLHLQVSKEGYDIIKDNIAIQIEFIELDLCLLCYCDCNQKVRFKQCGHSMCVECVNKINKRSCPMCRSEFEPSFAD